MIRSTSSHAIATTSNRCAASTSTAAGGTSTTSSTAREFFQSVSPPPASSTPTRNSTTTTRTSTTGWTSAYRFSIAPCGSSEADNGLHAFHQGRVIEGLGDVAVGAEGEAAHDALRLRVGRDDDH